MHTHRSLLLALTTAAAMTLAGAAHAAPPSGKPPSGKEEALTDKARELYREGEHLYKKGEFGPARAALLAAWALKKHYQVAHALADCEMQLGLYRDAAEHLAYAIREGAREGGSSEEEKKLYEEAKAHIGTVVVTSNQRGAEVRVNDVVVGTTPLLDPVFLEPGFHKVEVRLGAASTMHEFELKKGKKQPLDVSWGAPSAEGGQADRETPPAPALPALNEGGADRRILIAGAVTSGAALGLGVAFTVVANIEAGSADRIDPSRSCREAAATALAPEQCAAAQELRGSTATLGNVAFWSFVGAGAVGAATVAYAVLAPRASSASTGVRVLPMAGANGGGLALLGRW